MEPGIWTEARAHLNALGYPGWLRGALFLALLLVVPAAARAQTQEPDPWEAARWRFGPLAVTPRIELKNLGWDSNVFNETQDPKSDFTTTVGAPVDWWLRLGRARLHGVDYFEGVYFATYSDQSSFNQRHELTLLVPLNRIRPYIGGSYISTSDRPGYEINARVHHTESAANVGIVVRLTSKVDVDVSGRQTKLQVRRRSGCRHTLLREVLDRTVEITAPNLGTDSRR